MSLLNEIQTDAVDGKIDLESLLRKCRILASRLKHNGLKHWVQAELDGYSDGAELPDYRRLGSFHCFGHFSGPWQSRARNAPIPGTCIPDEFRDSLTQVEVRDGVGAIADLIGNSSAGNITHLWPAEAGMLFGRKIYANMQLIQGWVEIPRSGMVGILSTIRNRVLNFALEIEASDPSAGESSQIGPTISQSAVTQIFHTNIYGNVGNVASGNRIQQITITDITAGNLQSLEAYLKQLGISNGDIKNLAKAIGSDPQPTASKFGRKVAQWLGKMVQRAAEGTLKVGVDVASKVISDALRAYYGI